MTLGTSVDFRESSPVGEGEPRIDDDSESWLADDTISCVAALPAVDANSPKTLSIEGKYDVSMEP